MYNAHVCTHHACQHHFDFKERVWRGLPVSVDGSGELEKRPLDVESKGLLHHTVDLLCVGQPVRLYVASISTENLEGGGRDWRGRG